MRYRNLGRNPEAAKTHAPARRAFHDDARDVTEAVQQRRWVLALKTRGAHMSATHSHPNRVLGVREYSGGVSVRRIRHGSGLRRRCHAPSTC